jgi:uncharacterized membrane protein
MENSGKSALGLDGNVAAGLAYLPVCGVSLIMSIIILVTDKTNKFARFAAFQSLLLIGVMIAGYVIAMVITVAGAASESTIISLLGMLIWLVLIIVPVLCSLIGCIMAFMGKQFRLPVIGDMADKWSN